ncbi:M20/M25/M40 family metallo-hydrolase [Pseudonocardia sp. HH130630-07]|uniref:M20/M25/M40 family metallo-hydrolase n=1 Tax=Pseudonocardia sp. HH130630-07 TaxID=1690815 RepID=UPI000A75AC54|nr:M20/M25/M40 family metallo-hydrolase [Pseudonocardia sp. HH130630-07]
MAGTWRDLGARTRPVPAADGAHLLVEIDGTADRAGEAPVLCLGHHDTVWPAGTLDGPVPLRVAPGPGGDVLHGPGVYDMKGGLVVLETAVRALRASGRGHRPIHVCVVADEEVGSPTARDLVRARARDSVAVLGFEPPHPDGALKTARWGSTRLRLTCTGRESHAALAPEDGVSAVDELVDQLVAARALAVATPGVLCNAGTLGGGGRTNVVAGHAWCDLGLRFETPAAETAVLDRLAAPEPVRPGAVVRGEILASRPPWPGGPGCAELLALAARAGAACGQDVDGRPARGAADTNLVGDLGVPVLDGLGPQGRGAHAPDEQIRLDSLPERAALVTELLAAL